MECVISSNLGRLRAWAFSLAFFAIVGFAFPAAVDPPILFGRLADELFEMVGIPLCEKRHAAVFKVRVERIADRGGTDFIMQRPADAAGVADHRRCVVGQ